MRLRHFLWAACSVSLLPGWIEGAQPPPDRAQCGAGGAPALQVLGSGGPLNGEGRASSGYLLWLSSRAELLFDVGSGTMTRFAGAGASVRDLDAMFISHIHPDHVSDLPELLWSADVAGRRTPLRVVGPEGRGDFPDIKTYISRIFGSKGAFAFMHDLLDDRTPFHLEITAVTTGAGGPSSVADLDGVHVSAYPVPHGAAPTLAFRADGAGFSVVFAGDQNGSAAGFAAFARDADVMVLDSALSAQGVHHPFAKVIGTPQILGRMAEQAHVKGLILSHLMGFPVNDPAAKDFSLSDPEGLLRAVRRAYRGRVSLAADLQCFPLPPRR